MSEDKITVEEVVDPANIKSVVVEESADNGVNEEFEMMNKVNDAFTNGELFDGEDEIFSENEKIKNIVMLTLKLAGIKVVEENNIWGVKQSRKVAKSACTWIFCISTIFTFLGMSLIGSWLFLK